MIEVTGSDKKRKVRLSEIPDETTLTVHFAKTLEHRTLFSQTTEERMTAKELKEQILSSFAVWI